MPYCGLQKELPKMAKFSILEQFKRNAYAVQTAFLSKSRFQNSSFEWPYIYTVDNVPSWKQIHRMSSFFIVFFASTTRYLYKYRIAVIESLSWLVFEKVFPISTWYAAFVIPRDTPYFFLPLSVMIRIAVLKPHPRGTWRRMIVTKRTNSQFAEPS